MFLIIFWAPVRLYLQAMALCLIVVELTPMSIYFLLYLLIADGKQTACSQITR